MPLTPSWERERNAERELATQEPTSSTLELAELMSHTPHPAEQPGFPRIAVTLGDPAGVGPEIVLRLFREGRFPSGAVPFVVGAVHHLERAARQLSETGTGEAELEPIARLEAPPNTPPTQQDARIVPVVEPPDATPGEDVETGQVSAACGRAAWGAIRHAVELVQRGSADAIVTAPIHKEALRLAGCPYPGHTEMLAALAGGVRVAMLLVGGGLRVALATIHEPLDRVPGLLSIESLVERLRLMDRFLPWFGIEPHPDRTSRPCIGVTGLNPHAGEGGLFGDAESRTIAPAVEQARAEGIDALGPFPADTIYHFHREGAYDAVLAMYHDQGLIPVKTLDFHGGVNVTMGLPFVRTSVDHGTAFDIAGKGLARPGSLRAALECAVLLTRNRAKLENRAAAPQAVRD